MKKLLLKYPVFEILLTSLMGLEGLAATPNSRAFIPCPYDNGQECDGPSPMPICTAFTVKECYTDVAIIYAEKELGCNLNPYF